MATEIRFEWSPRKSESNLRKHGLMFEDAIKVFFDPLRRVDIEGDEHGEIRWRAIGQIGRRICIVSYTSREEGEVEINRIISARKADRHERQGYEEGL
jgi:uncharacterized DUF497 family protein